MNPENTPSMNRHKITVELFGPARRRSGQKRVAVELSTTATLRDVLAGLATKSPQLVGSVILVDSVIEPQYELSESYIMLILNYNDEPTARTLDETLEKGDHVLLLSADAGG